eukprot:353364-Chlamydomonas_euryale.AAC.3
MSFRKVVRSVRTEMAMDTDGLRSRNACVSAAQATKRQRGTAGELRRSRQVRKRGAGGGAGMYTTVRWTFSPDACGANPGVARAKKAGFACQLPL